MLRHALTCLAVGLSLLAACTHTPVHTQTDRDAPAYLEVENQLPDPYTMYVSDGAQRLRMGTVNPLTRTRLRIPRSVVFPAVTLQFIAVPLSGNGGAISEQLAVSPGETIGLTLGR